VSRYVEHGFFDCGLTGLDWIQGKRLPTFVEVCDLVYSRASTRKSRWGACVWPESSAIRRPEDLAGKRVATELVNTVKRYFVTAKIDAAVEFSWGATEVKVPDLVDAIVDINRDGLLAPGEQTFACWTPSSRPNTKFIANRKSWADPVKRKKIENNRLLLRGALEAGSKVGLKMNAPKASLEAIIKGGAFAAQPDESRPSAIRTGYRP